MAFSQGARSLTAEGRARVIKDFAVIKPQLVQAGDVFHIQLADAGLAQQEFFSALQDYYQKVEQGITKPLLVFIDELGSSVDRINANSTPRPEAFSVILKQAQLVRDIRLVPDLDVTLTAWGKLLELQKILASRQIDSLFAYQQLVQKINLSASLQDRAQRSQLLAEIMEIMRDKKPLYSEISNFDLSAIPQGNLTAEEFQALIIEGTNKKLKVLNSKINKADEINNQFYDTLIKEIKTSWDLTSQSELRNWSKVIEQLKQHLINAARQHQNEGYAIGGIKAFLIQEGFNFVKRSCGNNGSSQGNPPPVNPYLNDGQESKEQLPPPPSYAQALVAPKSSSVVPSQVIYPQMVNLDAMGHIIHVDPQRSVRATVSTVKDPIREDDSPISRGSNGSNSSEERVNDGKESPQSAQRKPLSGSGMGSSGVLSALKAPVTVQVQPLSGPAVESKLVDWVPQSGGAQPKNVFQEAPMSQDVILTKLKQLEAEFLVKDDECKLAEQRKMQYIKDKEYGLSSAQLGPLNKLRDERKKIIDEHFNYGMMLIKIYGKVSQPDIYEVFPERFPHLNTKDSCGSKCILM